MKSLAAAPVSKRHNAQAEAMDRDLRHYQRLGVDAAARLAWKGCQAVLTAYRGGQQQGLGKVLRRELWQGVPLLTEGMLVSYLSAYLRVQQLADVKLAAYEDAMDFMENRLNLTTEQLQRMRSKFNSNAVLVYHRASAVAEKKLETAMTEIIGDGMHVRQGVMRLQQAFDAAGIMPLHQYHLETIYRTQTALAYSAGQRFAEKQPAIDEILWGYKYVTVGDDRVRPEHALLEGVTLPKDDDFWDENYPPNGWSCRCRAIPLFSEDEEVDAPDEPVEVDGRMVEAGADKGFEFDPGDLYGDVMDEAGDNAGEALEGVAAEEEGAQIITSEEIRDLIESLTPEEQERLADLLGIDLDALETGDLELAHDDGFCDPNIFA